MKLEGKSSNTSFALHRLRLPWPRGELASRIQVEVYGARALLHLGLAQGIRSVLVATALAIVALWVDTALAIPGLTPGLTLASLVPVTEVSGAGKSTLLAVLAGILDPTEGAVTIDGASAANDMRTAC